MNQRLAVPPIPQPWQKALAMIADAIAGEVRSDDVHRVLYATDASLYEVIPVGVAFPRDASDVEKIVRVANMVAMPVTARGAGTSLAGQAIGPGLVVDMTRHMNRILEIDVERRKVRVQPGVVRDDLNRALKPHGLLFGPETSTSNRCVIGGMIGNNSCGSRSIKYGTTRDHVTWVDVVAADAATHRVGSYDRAAWAAATDGLGAFETGLKALAELVGRSPQAIRDAFPKAAVRRRNTGYPLDVLVDSHLGDGDAPANIAAFLCGTEGTLGLVTEAELNVVPLPGAVSVVASHFDDVPESMRATVALVGHDPAAVELLDDRILALAALNPEQDRNRWFIQGEPGALLITEFHADTQDAADEAARAAVADLEARGMGYAHAIIPPARVSSVWALRVAGLGVLFGKPGDVKPITIVEDTAVAVDELPAFVDAFAQIMDRHEIDCVYYGHASVGELHLRPELNPKDAADVAKAEAVAGEVADLVRTFGASLSGEHGDGRLRSPFIDRSMRGPVSAWLAEIKYAFDATGILNPGNIVDAAPMTDDWRYSPTYEAETRVETEFAYGAAGGFQRAVERCNGAGVCRKPAEAGGTMCPSFMATGEERETTRGRANLFRRLIQRGPDALFTSEELYQALDLCIGCKGCKSDCPASVDMATLKAEFLQGYQDRNGVKFRNRAFAEATEWARPAQKIPGGAAIANIAQSVAPFSWIGAKVLGLTTERTPPPIAAKSFHASARGALGASVAAPLGRVLLFVDEFTDRYEPEIGMAAVELLHAGGYEVVAPVLRPSGRTYLSKGFVRDARKNIEANIAIIEPLLDGVDAVVGVEPSAVLTMVDEALDLPTSDAVRASAKRIADKVALVQDFVADAAAAGKWRAAWTDRAETVHLHGHCHQKASTGVAATARALALPPNFDVHVIPSGCCGMCGSFGYEAEHYDVSMRIAELVLLPAVRESAASDLIAAPGTSCRHQIHDGAGRTARHPIEILRDALA